MDDDEQHLLSDNVESGAEEAVGIDRVPTDESSGRLLLKDDSLRTYRRRWLVILVVSVVVFEEGCVWNTWGPIAQSAELVFDWSDANIALLANWGCAAYVLGSFPLSYMLDVKGLRKSMILAAVLVASATGLRVVGVAFDNTTATVLINLGHILNGLSAPITFGVPSVLSATWFPPEQRVTATALLAIGPYAGVAASFLLGPHVVPDKNCTVLSLPTNHSNESMNFTLSTASQSFVDKHCIDHLSRKISLLMYIEFGFAMAVLLLIATVLPNKPPTPPSISSGLSRMSYLAGIKKLFRNRVYLIGAMVFGLSTGVYSGWGAVLSIILEDYNISQDEAGWIGFYATVAGAVGGVMMAWLADRFSRRLRYLILFLFLVSAAMFTWFAVSGQEGVYTKSIVYITNIVGGLSLNACIPLFYEMSVEVAYPIAEGVTTIVLSLLQNLYVIVFLLILLIPGIKTLWMSWVLAACCLLALPALLLVREAYARLDLDRPANVSSENSVKEQSFSRLSRLTATGGDHLESES